MPKLVNRPLLDAVLRDQAKTVLGRTPVQSWLKPDQVELRRRKPLSKTAADYISTASNTRRAGIDKSANGPTYQAEMEFVLEPPWSDLPTRTTRVRPDPDIFERFLTLADASDQKIQTFASSFGALLVFGQIEQSEIQGKLVLVETCEMWRYLALSMRSLLRIASCFHVDCKSDPGDWQHIGACPASLVPRTEKPRDLLSPTSWSGEEAWLTMAHFVRKGTDRDRKMWTRLLNVLLQLGRVRPWLVWEGQGNSARPNLVFSGPNLLSYLALQLSLRASKRDAFAVCCYCSQPYSPLGRAPKTGQRNFCPDCRRGGVPLRLAQRSRRERLREHT